MGAFKRIQAYLLLEPRGDSRQGLHERVKSGQSVLHLTHEHGSIELSTIQPRRAQGTPEAIITLDCLTAHYPGATASALKDITTVLMRGSLTMVLGPVGSGKTTLLKTVLGELAPVSGRIQTLTTEMGFCGQTPWLPNQSIREIICGPREASAIDEAWYSSVVHACALAHDIAGLLEGDRSVIGSKGLTLSGGQRQRLVRVLLSFAPGLLIRIGTCSRCICAPECTSTRRHLERTGCPNRASRC